MWYRGFFWMLQFPVLSGISKQKKRSHCSVSIFMQRTRSPEPATRGHGKRRRASRRSLVSEASSWPWPHRLRRMRRPRPPAWQKPNPDMYVVSCLQAAKGGFFFFFFFSREDFPLWKFVCASQHEAAPSLLSPISPKSKRPSLRVGFGKSNSQF